MVSLRRKFIKSLSSYLFFSSFGGSKKKKKHKCANGADDTGEDLLFQKQLKEDVDC
jgi:hypothetical protein